MFRQRAKRTDLKTWRVHTYDGRHTDEFIVAGRNMHEAEQYTQMLKPGIQIIDVQLFELDPR